MSVNNRNSGWRNERALITGASGFIGRHLVAALLASGASVGALLRPSRADDVRRLWSDGQLAVVRGDLMDHATLAGICRGWATVFHLAGYAHAEDSAEARGEEMHWKITVDGTRGLLRQAIDAGVKRFVFVSTVKAMGEDTDGCVDESGPANPVSAYGRTKLAAERLVLEAGVEHGMHVSVLRLPLVYGRDNRGNIPRMIAAIDRGRFPPLPEVNNRRSMVHVDDVVQALLLAAKHSTANGHIYLATDGRQYSTRQIELLIRVALGKPVPRWAVPQCGLRIAARFADLAQNLLNRQLSLNSVVLQKLLGSACYDSSRIERDLGFRPRYTLRDVLPEMVAEYRRSRQQPQE